MPKAIKATDFLQRGAETSDFNNPDPTVNIQQHYFCLNTMKFSVFFLPFGI